jgi:hypothetical protein
MLFGIDRSPVTWMRKSRLPSGEKLFGPTLSGPIPRKFAVRAACRGAFSRNRNRKSENATFRFIWLTPILRTSGGICSLRKLRTIKNEKESFQIFITSPIILCENLSKFDLSRASDEESHRAKFGLRDTAVCTYVQSCGYNVERRNT